MKRIITALLVFLLTFGPLFSYASVAAQAVSVTVSSEQAVESAHETGTSSDPSESQRVSEQEEPEEATVSTATETTTEKTSEESSFETTTSTMETTDSSVETEAVSISFQTTNAHPFSNGKTKVQVNLNKGQMLSLEDLPRFAQEDNFEGWSIEDVKYSSEELIALAIQKDLTITAVFKAAIKSRAANSSLAETSIKDIVAEADKTSVLAVPSPKGDGAAYATYANSVDGVRQALFDMYQNGSGQEFALYLGSGGTLTLTSLVSKTIPSTVDQTNMTFSALQGKVRRLILTGHSDDPITDATSLTSGSRTVAFGTNAYFGSDIVVRNLNYTGSNLYMNGHSLSLNGGSTGNGFSIYGGSDTGDVTGNPTITINATGSSTWNVYGGNQNGGTLTGNPTIVVNNTVSGINTITGGANIGTVIGNVNNIIKRINGTLTNFFGGGVGTNSSNTANVTGEIKNTFEIDSSGSSFRFNNYYGGVQYGNVSGSISNDLSGSGGWANRGPFVGGSAYGNIGSSIGEPVITNRLDASQYSTYGPNFVGANRYKGVITGNISNTVKAGLNPTQGGMGDFDGGGGIDASRLTKGLLGGSNETIYDAYSPQERATLAFNSAEYKIIGDIHSHLVRGSFGNQGLWRTTAAGLGGYVEGNATIEVGSSNEDGSFGGEGLVYTGTQRSASELYYSSTRNSFANQRDFDIAGGGLVIGRDAWTIYIKGDTHTIINNAIARRTYGGLFSGVVEGNTNITLKAGIVDTLEGTGYEGGRVFGNGTATVYDGQVDWFLSGGGWNDKKIVGDVSVSVHDGVINASMGASYGASSDHTVTGDSNMRVYGGDFSGTPREGSNGFSGGITNVGSLLGNANLTIDLREYNGKFGLPSGTNISGGRPPGNNTTLGTDENNMITVNILTAAGSDVLNGAIIFGDGGPTGSAGNGRIGKINMNIQAEGSSIGTLYATNYPNVANSRILKDVLVNVQGAKSINGISGGNSAAASDLTNTIVNNSTNQIRMNFGENVDGSNHYQTDPMSITGLGVVNFTELTVTNGIKLMANGGDIKNGRSVTANNHGTTYHQFGAIHLSKDAGIGISSASNLISGAKLTVEDEGTIESPPGTGRINISDFDTPNPEKDHLTWVKTTANDPSARVNSSGTWFGDVVAYQVLTVNPTKTNASTITPVNFSGIEKSTGKTFIGDNDVTQASNGYGIAIPGSIIDYEVENPGIANGAGTISHNVSGVKANNAPLTLTAWGTEQENTPVQKGRLMIPYTGSNLPTLTFTPETTNTGSWFYEGNIKSSKVNSENQVLAEEDTSKPVEWTSQDGEYSYTVTVRYSNKAQVHARHVIITEQEAEAITKEEVLTYLEASGRPFFTDDLTDEALAEISAPLGEAVYRKHALTFSAGESADNQAETTVNLVVVRNESVYAQDRQFAVYAKDVRLTLPEAAALTDEKDLAAYTEATTIFADDRENVLPDVSAEAFAAIQQATEDELLKNVSTDYRYAIADQLAEKTVNVAIAGELILASVPERFDFGKQKISTANQDYWPTIAGDLAVRDTRGSERSAWRLTVKEQQPLTNGSDHLTEVFRYVKDGEEQIINAEEVIVEETELAANGTVVVNQQWNEENNEGIKLTVPVQQQTVGAYNGTLSWQLVSAPENP